MTLVLGVLAAAPAPAPGPAWGTLLTTWRTTWGVEVVVTALAALYLRTAVHVGRWPVTRTVAATVALAVVVVTVDSGIGAAAPRSFSVGVVMQLLLGIVVPALWVAGRPLELLRRGSAKPAATVSDRLRGRLVVRALSSPPTVLVVYALVVALTRLTALPVAATTSPVLQVLEPLLWLGAGMLLFHTALGHTATGFGPRFLLLLGATVVTTAVGIVLAAVPAHLLAAFPPDDVQRGGTLLWAVGDVLMVMIAAALAYRRVAGRAARLRDTGDCPVC